MSLHAWALKRLKKKTELCFAHLSYVLHVSLQLRLQSCLDTNPDLAQKFVALEAEKAPEKEAKVFE